MNRRSLLKLMGAAGLTLSNGRLRRLAAQDAKAAAPSPASPPGGVLPDVVWVEKGEPLPLLDAALNALGGMKRFVSVGDIVVIKPNIGWDRSPEMAATTNPDLIAALVKECLKVGAKKVRVFDRTCNNPRRCYASSGIQEKAEAAGAEVFHIDDSRFKTVALKDGEVLKEWPIFQDYLDAHKVINVPVAKHHGLSTVSLGIKNLMGVMGGDRGSIHSPLEKKLIDIAAAIPPALTIIDGYRTLLRNGPQGGRTSDVKLTRTLVASPCMVAADYAALPLFGISADEVEYLREAVRRGLNRVPVKNMNLKKISLS